jgi:Family of unknown function (DUF5677)
VSPVVDDDFPAPDVIAAANVELVALVRRRLPEGFYGGERWWALFATAALARMADTVESLMTLMASGHDTDGQTLLRSLYEQAVTFAWIAIEPDGRQIRWRDDGRWEMLKLHRDALTVGLTILSDAEVDDTKNGLSLTDRKQPEADRVLPPVPERALRADEHWSAQISGLHPPNHPLSLSRHLHARLPGCEPPRSRVDGRAGRLRNREEQSPCRSPRRARFATHLGARRPAVRHRPHDCGTAPRLDRRGCGASARGPCDWTGATAVVVTALPAEANRSRSLVGLS